MNVMVANGKQRVIIGMGKTGLSCARYLRSCGEYFAWADTRANPPALADLKMEFADIELHCGELDASLLCAASEIIVSPGVSVKEPALQSAAKAGVPLIGDIELFVRATKKPVIAITGSNAKSTVTTLVGEMAGAGGLNAGVGGNLGTPVLDMLASDDETDCYVLELSSFQLETTSSLRAQVAAVLNISEDHMDRYDSLQDYVDAKLRIYGHSANNVFNRADGLTRPGATTSGRCWTFGLDPATDVDGIGVRETGGESWLVRGADERLMPLSNIRIAGKHNQANVAAAFAIALAAGWNVADCVSAVKNFAGLPHRCQWVADKHGVHYYNDSKGTNIGATMAAIEGLACGSNIVLIAGGEGKGADFSQLAPMVEQHVLHLVLIGRDAEIIASACNKVPSIFATSMDDAVGKSQQLARAGDVVLLSPACASFDMFNGYEDRGNRFCAAVGALA